MKIEQAVFQLEKKLTQALNSFNQYLKTAIDHMKASPYPYDAIHPLTESKKVLMNIFNTIKETGQLEEQLVTLTKTEKDLLNKERKTT